MGIKKNGEALAESTVYTRLSHLSAYFESLRTLPEFAHFIKINPVRLAMPKPPKKYKSPKSKSLTDENLSRLWNFLEKLTEDETNKVAIRDYAIFRIFMAIGTSLGCRSSDPITLDGETQTKFNCDINAPNSHPFFWSPFVLIGNWR